jgi:hypothetical protein
MATRSIIKVNYEQTNITFYRHWDGYLAEGGYDLACILKHNSTAEKFIKQLIQQKRGLSELENNTPLYEIVHSDNMGEEFIYTFNFVFNGGINVKVEKLEGWAESYWKTVFETQGEAKEVVKELLKICKEDRAEVEKRVKNRIQQGEMVSLY